MSPLAENLFDLVRAIPFGQCATYGTLGRLLPHTVSGLTIGRWMAVAPPDVPWHRVVGKEGDILTGKRDPHLAQEQESRLRREGVSFLEDGRVDLSNCRYDP